VKAIREQCAIEFSSAYIKDGAKGRARQMLVLAEPFFCAHLANCIYKTKLHSNAHWGNMCVDATFLARYPRILDVKLGDPAIRMTKDIALGDEILLLTYGAGYWRRNKQEQKWDETESGKRGIRLLRGKVLPPSVRRVIAETAAEADDARRGLMRVLEGSVETKTIPLNLVAVNPPRDGP